MLPVVAGLLAAAALVACDAEQAPRSAILELDLSRHGIDEIVAEEDGRYALVGGDGEALGQLERELDDGHVALSIELQGAAASLSWTPDGNGHVECEPVMAGQPGDDPIAPCSTELTVAAEIAEAEGLDVPGFTPVAADVGFRRACETVTTWVWGVNDCDGCYDAAAADSSYGNHQGGSCSSSLIATNCTHTFCSDGFVPVAGGHW
jgi:hypothetical protein